MRLAALLAACLAWPASAAEPAPKVLVAPYAGIITPVAAEFLGEAVARAERDGHDALLIELDTPGGLDLSMREIVKTILSARVPVVVFVHPTGARAASAGVFITMAAHVAAMAPGTNIGAAHPVAIPMAAGGGKPEAPKKDEILESKAVNDAAAYLKSIAQKRGRNADWAFEAAARSTSIPAGEAASLGVIDLVSASREDLLAAIHGKKLAGFDKPLNTKGAAIERHEMTRRQRLLAAIVNPNVAMILMSLGAGGLFIELYNPGLILPGIVGAIALILAFYAFETLSVSYAGVLLLLAGFAFFILEVKIASFGLLALGGIVATTLGALMLFQNDLGGLSVSWSVIAGTVLGFSVLTAFASWLVLSAYKRRLATGAEGMVGLKGKALSAVFETGKVMVQGEIWEASSATEIPEGADIVVAAVDGLRLKVRKK